MVAQEQDFGKIKTPSTKTIYRFWWMVFNAKNLRKNKKKFFDFPIISTNNKYLSKVKKSLKKSKIKKYKIILEPVKKILHQQY